MINPALAVGPTSIAVALLVDAVFGEPPASVHPVVWMGKLIEWLGRGLPERKPSTAFAGGAVGWIAGACLVTGLAWGARYATFQLLDPGHSWFRAALAAMIIGVLLKSLMAWRPLREEVQAVEGALARGISEGRVRIARLAGRDPTALTPVEVCETAIESLAENLNDSVVAPLFWFAVAGLPGAALYRFANTADAMWGTRGRWEWAGKWAARADDVFSWIPARLTALALVSPARWRGLLIEARQTTSPNGGWPMGAMALRLGVRLGRPGFYVLNDGGRTATTDDTARAVSIATRALGFLLLPLLVLRIAVGGLA